MAKRMTEAQADHLLKAMNLTYSPLPLDDPRLFGFHCCDRCGKETPSGQYVDETDQWLCNDCLVWLQEAAETAEHSRIEENCERARTDIAKGLNVLKDQDNNND